MTVRGLVASGSPPPRWTSRHLRPRRGASNLVRQPIPQVAGYTAAKCAVVGLTRVLAAEWSGQGVRVNAVAPGWIETSMSAKAFANDPARKARVLARTPSGTLGQPADVGHAVVYLCTPAAAFVTGAVLPVDGGASIGF